MGRPLHPEEKGGGRPLQPEEKGCNHKVGRRCRSRMAAKATARRQVGCRSVDATGTKLELACLPLLISIAISPAPRGAPRPLPRPAPPRLASAPAPAPAPIKS